MGQGVCLQLGFRQKVPLGRILGARDREGEGKPREGALGDGIGMDEAGEPNLAFESGRFWGPVAILEKL